MDRFIDAAVEQFAHDHTEPETDLYARLREETYRVVDWPQMQVGRLEGRFLKMLVRLTGARSIFEIGMFTGYSALMMAEALPEDGRLITCEIDPKAEAIARKYFAKSSCWRGKSTEPRTTAPKSFESAALNQRHARRAVLSTIDLLTECLTVRDGMMLAWKRK